MSNALDALLFGYDTIRCDGGELPKRNALDILGATVTDNPVTGRTEVNLASRTVVQEVAFADSPATIEPDVSIVLVNSTAGAVVCVLPKTGLLGSSVIVKDVGGAAATNTITIQPPVGGHTVDGGTLGHALSENLASVEVVVANIAYSGSTPLMAWFAIGK